MRTTTNFLISLLIVGGLSLPTFAQNAAFFGGNAASAPAGTAITACGDINSAGPYYLANTVTSNGTCLNLLSDNVTLNMNGYNIVYGNANQTLIVAGILGIRCDETLWANGLVEQTTGACSDSADFQNFNLQGPGQILQGAGAASLPQDSNNVFLDSSFSGNGYTQIGPTINDVSFNFSSGNSLGLSTNYGNAPEPGGARLTNNTFNNGKTGPTCTSPSCRSVLQGSSAVIANATVTTVPAVVQDNVVSGGVQGGIMVDAPGSMIQNNVPVTPGNPAGEYTNNSGLYIWGPGQTVQNNVIGSNPPSADMDTRGIDIDLIEFTQGGGVATGSGNTLVTANVVNVIGKNNNAEYGGCQIGGAYGIHFTHGAQTSASTLNTVNAFANECPSAGLRLSTPISNGNTSSGNTYKGILCATATCGLTASLAPTNLLQVAGMSCDDSPGGVSQPFVSTGDTFDGDQSSFSVWADGCGEVDLVSATLGDAGNHIATYKTFSYGNDVGESILTKCIDCTYTGAASKTSTDMPVGNGTPFQLSRYFSEWSWDIRVIGAVSGLPISGATVTVVASAAGGGGTECSVTTSSAGYANCAFVSPTSENQLIEFAMQNSSTAGATQIPHNPHTVTISGGVCTTYTNTALTITQKTTGVVISLAGC